MMMMTIPSRLFTFGHILSDYFPDGILSCFPVFPVCQAGGDMFSKVEERAKGLEEEEARGYFRQMVKGLLFMKQTSGLAHRDVR